jgi:hypothetical protein
MSVIAPTSGNSSSRWTTASFQPWAGGIAAFLALAGAFIVPALPDGPALPVAWAISAILLVVFCALIGIAISGRPAGLIIDNRNRVSLSKLQAAAWSIVVLSAFVAAVFFRLRQLPSGAADIDIPQELLAVMGISATSLVAAPVILSLKSSETPVDGQEADTAGKLGDNINSNASVGKVYARGDATDAQWLDIFRGEEVSNAASPDLSKLQQFLITVVVLAVYSGAIWGMFAASGTPKAIATGITSLPKFSEHLAWLVGISHAGYLAYKAAPHGASAGPSTPAAAGPSDDAVG